MLTLPTISNDTTRIIKCLKYTFSPLFLCYLLQHFPLSFHPATSSFFLFSFTFLFLLLPFFFIFSFISSLSLTFSSIYYNQRHFHFLLKCMNMQGSAYRPGSQFIVCRNVKEQHRLPRPLENEEIK